MAMKAMVEEMYKEWKNNKDGPSQGNKCKGKGEGGGGDPPKTPSSSSPSSSSSSTILQKKEPKIVDSNFPKPWLKLYVKFDLLMYDGELNTEKMDNRIKKIKVYCRVQKIMDEEEKV